MWMRLRSIMFLRRMISRCISVMFVRLLIMIRLFLSVLKVCHIRRRVGMLLIRAYS